MQQEMDGLENISVINERITKEKSENIMDQMLIQRSQQGDNSALMAIVEIYNNPKNKGEILEKYFTAQGEQPSLKNKLCYSKHKCNNSKVLLI